MGTTGGGILDPETAKRILARVGEMAQEIDGLEGVEVTVAGRVPHSVEADSVASDKTDFLLDVIARSTPALAETECVVMRSGEIHSITPEAIRFERDTSGNLVRSKDLLAGTGVLVPALAEELQVWDKAGLMLADLDALRARFIPAEGEVVVEDEFIQRGVDLVAVGRNTFIVLGELLQWKMDAERCKDELSRNAVIERYGPAWGVSTSVLWKAWTYANRFPGLMLPEDTSQTLAYEVISGCRTREEAEAVLDRAIAEGWSVKDVREIKSLRSRGLLKEWVRLKLAIGKGGILQVLGPEGPVGLAAYFQCHEGDEHEEMLKAGIALLEMRAGL